MCKPGNTTKKIALLAAALSVCIIAPACGSLHEMREEDSSVIDAVINNDVAAVRTAIRNGFSSNRRLPDGWTLLHVAARWDTPRVSRLCLNGGRGTGSGTFDRQDTGGPVKTAAVEMMSLLLENGGDISLADREGNTPLQVALASLRVDDADIPSIPPVQGTISSRFGWRGSPFDNTKDYHRGLDISAKNGTPVRAAADGTVAGTGISYTLGNYIIIRHRNGYESLYGHCHLFKVKRNDRVRRGAIIAYVGRTGAASGDHCHYEVHQNGALVDPLPYLDENMIHDAQHAIVRGLVELALQRKAPVDAVNGAGRTLLIEAASKSTAISRLLIDHGADVNRADENGVTPLHMAAAAGPELVRILLEKGARVNPRTMGGYCAIGGILFAPGTTPLRVAARYGNIESAGLLKRAGGAE